MIEQACLKKRFSEIATKRIRSQGQCRVAPKECLDKWCTFDFGVNQWHEWALMRTAATLQGYRNQKTSLTLYKKTPGKKRIVENPKRVTRVRSST